MKTSLLLRSPWLHTPLSRGYMSKQCTRERPRKHVPDRIQTANTISSVVVSYVPQLLAGHPGWSVGLLVNSIVYIFAIRLLLKGLTWAGVLHSWFLGSSIFSAFGLRGYLLVCIYYLLGSRVTKIKLEQKEAEGIAEERSGRRSIGNVWGSGLAGAACAVLSLSTGNYDFYQIGFVASFCSKLSDTVSSEIGKAFGQTTFLVTTFEKCPRGTEGAISLEGTSAGIGVALAYSLIAYLLNQVTLPATGIVFFSCVISNFLESYIGATVQGSISWLTNELVNLIQITIAATLAISLQQLLLS